MHVQRSDVEWVVQAPAKLNLFFEVLAKREDGYHEIETLMCPVGLYDTLSFRERPRGQLELSCQRVNGASGPADPEGEALPEGRKNLVLRAVELLRQQAGVDSGATLRLVKRIPIAAGLGGGSSDAAAALVAANRGWGLGRSPDQLARISAQLGSDVPFFLGGGPAICRGRGERVEPVARLAALHFVVVYPPEGLSTAAVYAACRPATRPQALAPLLEALSRGDIFQTGRLLFNRLQPAAEKLSPWIKRLQRRFADEDILGHGMSGSGTSYFGLCRHARHARRVARRLQANGVGSVFAVQSCR
ncbi:MAG: 4-(cytidine 5'-diphospho)-2-C-methyl-D-erythritol kinase [Planctomycetota bacterium]|jgi:4-diphosphocytidyl-2-C-methyl-D-erythritol kinase